MQRREARQRRERGHHVDVHPADLQAPQPPEDRDRRTPLARVHVDPRMDAVCCEALQRRDRMSNGGMEVTQA